MSEIKDQDLTTVTELQATDYIRGINWATKDSVKILLSDLNLTPAQITGLVAALAGKIPLSATVSEMAYIDALGKAIGSGLKRGILESDEHLNVATSGIYTVLNGSTYATDTVMGNILNVIALSDSDFGTATSTFDMQLITASNGLFLRERRLGVWSNPRYVGGSQNCLAYKYEDLKVLSDASQLTPGVSYMITDHGNDSGIIIRSANSSVFYSDGIRLGLVPAHYLAGTYETIPWIGVWRISIGDAGVSIGNKAVFMGRVWTNKTGNIGTVHPTDVWSLDATNWTLSPVELGADYVSMVFGVTYDFSTDYISKQWDNKGNVFGEDTAPTDGFLVDYNDWNIGVDGGLFENNQLRRFYDISIFDTNIFIGGNHGEGSIYSMNMAESSGIAYNTIDINGSIYSNSVSEVIYMCYINNVIWGNSIRTITDSKILGGISGNVDVWLESVYTYRNNWIINNDFDEFRIYDSSISVDIIGETFTAHRYIRDDITPFKPTTGRTLVLETPVWDDINFNISSIKLPAANPPIWTAFTANTNAYTWNVGELADLGSVEYLHGFKNGADFHPHIHVTTNGTNTTERKVKYTIHYTIGVPSSAWTAEASLTQELTIPANTATLTHFILDMGTVSGTNVVIGTQIKMSLTRITATGTAPTGHPFITQVGIHCQKDTMGSRSISTK